MVRGFTRGARGTLSALVAVIAISLCFSMEVPAFAEPAETPAPVSPSTPPTGDVDSDGDGSPDRPDTAAAAVTATVLDEPVEDLSQRGESSRVVANPDGSFTEEAYGAPMWIQDAGGAWVDVDYSLVPRPEGGFVPKAAPTDLVIDGGSKEFARLVLPDGAESIWSWPQVLPTPSVDGPVATYAVADGVDLLVIATARGVSTRIRVNHADAVVPNFRVNVRTVGADLQHSEDGTLVVTEGDIEDASAGTSTLLAWDGRRDAWGDPVKVVPVEAELAETASKGERTDHALTLPVPEELVEDPEVVYPITIDPDMAGFGPTQDTWVREGVTWISDLTYRLIVGASEDHANSNPAMSYLQWDNARMRNRTISDAEVGLFQYMSASCSARTVYLYPLTTSWDEGTTEFSNRPGRNGAGATNSSFSKNVGASGCTPAGGWVTADVTAMAQGWADTADYGGFENYGLQMNVPVANEDNFSFERRLCSVDYDPTHTTCDRGSRTPYLKFTYTNRAPWEPTIPTVSSSGSTQRGLWTSTTSPTFTGSAVGVGGATVKLTYEVRTSETAATVAASCTSPLTSPGLDTSCAVSGLTNGSIYLVRAKATDSNGLVGPWSDWEVFGVDTTLVFDPNDGAWEDVDPRDIPAAPPETDLDAPMELPVADGVLEGSNETIWTSSVGTFTVDESGSSEIDAGPVIQVIPYTGDPEDLPEPLQAELAEAGVSFSPAVVAEEPGDWMPSDELLRAAGDCDLPDGVNLRSSLEACVDDPAPRGATDFTPLASPSAKCERPDTVTYLTRIAACVNYTHKLVFYYDGTVWGTVYLEVISAIVGSSTSLKHRNDVLIRRIGASRLGAFMEARLEGARLECQSIYCGAVTQVVRSQVLTTARSPIAAGSVTSSVPSRMVATMTSRWALTFTLNGQYARKREDYTDGVPLRCDNNAIPNMGKGCVNPKVTPNVTFSKSGKESGMAVHVGKAIASGLRYKLTRADEKTKKRNGDKACPSSLRKISKKWQCDEYPFRSSKQGATSGGSVRVFPGCEWTVVPGSGPTGFSRCQILAIQNGAGGNVLNAMYTSNRVLVGDNFTVNVRS